MSRPALHLVPGALGAALMLAVALRLDLAALPREVEAGIALVAGWAMYGAMRLAVAGATAEVPRVEAMLARVGQSGDDYAARRAATLVDEAEGRLGRLDALTADRTAPMQAAVARLRAEVEPLLTDLVARPEGLARADNLLRRTLPRLEDAVASYAGYAARGAGLVDTAETRDRLIEALDRTAAQAAALRRDTVASEGADVDITLDILEDSFAYARAHGAAPPSKGSSP